MNIARLSLAARLAPIGLAALLSAANARADLALDTSFDADGIAQVDVASGPDTARDIAVQADGALVLAGRSRQTSGASTVDYVAVTRVDGATGAVDATFGTDGIATFLPGLTAASGGGGDALALAIQPVDQKLVVVGTWDANEGAGSQVFVARLDTAGVLDPTFGTDGVVLLTPVDAADPVARAVALRSDGSIILAGTGTITGTSIGFVTALSSTGGTVPGFTDAVVTDPLPDSSDFGFNALAILAGDTILAAGGGGNLTVARFASNGALDTSFDGDGIASFNYLTFGSAEGPVETYDVATALSVLGDGRLLIAGIAANDSAATSTKRVLARATAGGALDPTFGSGGFAPLPDVSSGEVPEGLGVRPSGDIVLLGQGFAPTQVSPDGIATSAISGVFTPVLADLEVLGDGTVVAGGRRTISGSNTAFAAVRFTATDLANGPDTVPDPLNFTTQTGLATGVTVTSNTVTITGMDPGTSAPIAVQAGEYSIGCTSTFTTTEGTISNGQTVCIRLQASQQDSTARSARLDVGGSINFFTIVTGDATPDQFTFVDEDDVTAGTTITSQPVTLTGFTEEASVTIVGAGSTYSIGCTEPYTAAAGTVTPGAVICVRHTSSAFPGGTTNTVLRVGPGPGVQDTFTSTTEGTPDTTPEQFQFTDRVEVKLFSTVYSSPVTITGINAEAPVGIEGNGQYSIGCTSEYTRQAGVVLDGQAICVRQFAPGTLATQTDTVLTVGGVSDTFSSTTVVDELPGSSSMDAWSLFMLAPLLAFRRRRQ